jgi:hypothetical protein
MFFVLKGDGSVDLYAEGEDGRLQLVYQKLIDNGFIRIPNSPVAGL